MNTGTPVESNQNNPQGIPHMKAFFIKSLAEFGNRSDQSQPKALGNDSIPLRFLKYLGPRFYDEYAACFLEATATRKFLLFWKRWKVPREGSCQMFPTLYMLCYSVPRQTFFLWFRLGHRYLGSFKSSSQSRKQIYQGNVPKLTG